MNFGNTNHALIYPETDTTNKKSSIMYNEYIVSTGTILINLIQRKKLQKNIESHLLNNKIIIADGDEWMDLKSEIFVVIHANENGLIRRKARLKYLFNSPDIHESINDILAGFRSYKIPFDQIGMHQLLVSSFVILEFCDENSDASLINVMTEDGNTNESINKLDTVICVTTPFAHESFFETVNVSKVANVFGINNCLLVISAPLVYGCEGGGVYDSNR